MKYQEVLKDKAGLPSIVNKMKNDAGFTIIEVVLVLAVLLILVSAASPIYSNLQISTQVNESATQIVQNIRTAREYSVARFNDSASGIYLNITGGADSVILYQGNTYATRDTSYDRVFDLDEIISMTTNIVGSEINFSKGLGMPDNTGNITLSHGEGGSTVIVINSFGMVEEN